MLALTAQAQQKIYTLADWKAVALKIGEKVAGGLIPYPSPTGEGSSYLCRSL